MPTQLDDAGRVVYHLELGADSIRLNDLVGTTVAVTFTGRMQCIRCGREVNKLFGEGFCYPCFRDAPEASECIVHPELCEAHLGRGRDSQWEEAHHNQPHAVYLAVTSAVKVGVTRLTQLPTRWIDQGAAYAAQIARTPYRQLAGRLEVALKAMYTDRTQWQRMLKNETLPLVDFEWELGRIVDALGSAASVRSGGTDLRTYLLSPADLRPVTLRYPVLSDPTKVAAVNLLKERRVQDRLTGVRGQYLIFASGRVLNIRRHSGMEVEFSAPAAA